ncbi:hypothetical protein D9611_001109 [Ephemerocybe angulata]|uniref:Alpha-type protein kinase domain-containing protein n=1 Tax=Ephemerocybe angulata TaxID=980116 RepID=A0A8H5CK88_9AGAR|nr:hypothetical protein D9611_001109 [Tulosesus angulatus]
MVPVPTRSFEILRSPNVNEKVVISLIYPEASINDLLNLEKPSFLGALEGTPTYEGLLSVTPSPLGDGTFKTAHIAELKRCSESTGHLFRYFGGQVLVAKRLHFEDKLGVVPKQIPPVQEELRHIIQECNILYWCSTILTLTYHFIDSKMQEKGDPPFRIPRLRFVKSGFCYAKSEFSQSSRRGGHLLTRKFKETHLSSSKINRGYILEENITGRFVKYIGSLFPRPTTRGGTQLLSEAELETAEFLCFTQHVQYLQTKGYGYISDYQGSGDLLTDPQLMT